MCCNSTSSFVLINSMKCVLDYFVLLLGGCLEVKEVNAFSWLGCEFLANQTYHSGHLVEAVSLMRS